MSDTEAILNALAEFFGAGGGGSAARVRGGVHSFKVAQGTTMIHRADGNRRITSIRFIGTNTVISTSNATFNDINNATSYGRADILMLHTNQTEGQDSYLMNTDLPFADDPTLHLYINNGGAAGCYVSISWDYV